MADLVNGTANLDKKVEDLIEKLKDPVTAMVSQLPIYSFSGCRDYL